MSDPVKIKPEELWGVWDPELNVWWCDGDDWCTGNIIVMNESDATKAADDNHFGIASPIVDLSGWVRKEDAQ